MYLPPPPPLPKKVALRERVLAYFLSQVAEAPISSTVLGSSIMFVIFTYTAKCNFFFYYNRPPFLLSELTFRSVRDYFAKYCYLLHFAKIIMPPPPMHFVHL